MLPVNPGSARYIDLPSQQATSFTFESSFPLSVPEPASTAFV